MNRVAALKRRKLYTAIAYLLPVFLTAAILSGCAFRVKLVGQYDEITDRSVTEIQQQTAAFFWKMKTASPEDAAYKTNKGFYDDVQGRITTLIRRSEVIEEGLARNPLTRNFKDLQTQYEELAAQHEKGFSSKYLQSAEKAFDRCFRAILAHILYLKWNQTQPQK